MSARDSQHGHAPHAFDAHDPRRYREAQHVTWVSVGVNLLLTVAQIGVGVLAHAQSLVADGFHSLSDLLADFLVLAANFHSRHPADERHPYGHQRIETAASLALGVLLAITGAAILWSAGSRLQHLDELPAVSSLALWTAGATLLAKEGLFRYMLRVAKKLRSAMLVANAWHARSDAASSLVVVAGIGGSLAGYRFLDPVAAVIVGFMIARMGAQFAYEALQELIDTGASEEDVRRITETLRDAPGVIGVHDLRTRRMADRVMVDAHIQVDGRISVSEGHLIGERARLKALGRHPELLDVLVHVDAEHDRGAARAGAQLLGREELIGHLHGILGEDLPPFERTILHFLDNRVEAEVFLPAAVAHDARRLAEIEGRLMELLPTDPYFSAITLNCKVAPK